jgi:hypothetical protein
MFQVVASLYHPRKYRLTLPKLGPKGGFPFSGKSRAIDFLRPLSFEIQAIKRNG